MTRKHEHIGLVESKKLITAYNIYEELFLLDTDKTLQKVMATYGPFRDINELKEFASLRSIKVKYD